MASFTDYVSPDSVRTLLGISKREVSDLVITDEVNFTALLEQLYSVDPSLPANYLTAAAATNRTAIQNRFVMLAETVSAYSVAISMIPSLPMAAPQTITDGKTQLTRNGSPFEHLRSDLTDGLYFYTVKLKDAYAALLGQPAPNLITKIHVASASTYINPVTGA